jgi:DtxR family Mn-dependent transcriptional regulator
MVSLKKSGWNVMDVHKVLSSESEEMYLISIARLIENGADEPIPLSSLAEELSIQPVSVNQMVRKMEDEGLVEYFPYKGVTFTDNGRKFAGQILRLRRLWEVFFVTQLGLTPAEADRLACKIEHVTSRELADRLATHLGDPTLSPMGKPIPNKIGEVAPIRPRSLSKLGVGTQSEITHLDADPASSVFFESQGIQVGELVSVLATSSDGVMLISIGDREISLDTKVAERIFVMGT